jgi:hypothetical protein
MIKAFETIGHLYELAGIWGVIIGLIVIGIALLLWEVIKNLVKKVVDKYMPPKEPPKDITQSSFFTKMTILLHYKIPRFNAPCPLRRRIFRRLLKCCVETWRDRVKEKITDPELNTYNQEAFVNFWSNFIYKTTDLWEAKAIQLGVPEVAIEKYRTKHNKTLELAFIMLNQIAHSELIYPSNLEKNLAILDFIAIVLDLSLLDVEKTVMEINGELSQTTFEGASCEQCDKECVHRIKNRNK